jgi:hypothetical protein
MMQTYMMVCVITDLCSNVMLARNTTVTPNVKPL